jgi:hypothetical protein
MKDDSLQCAKCNRQTVLYQEVDGSFVCGWDLSDEVIDRYPGFRQELALSFERSERMTAINQQRAAGAQDVQTVL